MRKLIPFLCLVIVGFSSVAQQPFTADSFTVKNEIIPINGFEKLTKEPTDSKTIIAAPAVIVDTQRVIIYDTVKIARESTRENVDSVAKKVVDGAKNELKKITKETTDKIPSLNDVINFGNIFWSLVILVLAYFFIKFLVVIVERFAEKSTTYRIGLRGLTPFIRIIGWIVALIWVVEGIFKPPHAAILTFLASAGIAIGFAAQDILKNIFGGIMILFDRPFQVGDKIEVGNYYGEVKEIGLRSTRVVTKDDSLVSVPNAEVVNSAVSNSNAGEANCQVVAEIYLPIDADTNLARVIATEAAQVSRYIYLNKPIVVLFFNDVKERRSYIKMRLKAYVSDIRNEFAFQSDMTEIVIKEFIKQGVIKKDDVK